MDLKRNLKIAVVGNCASGKTTLVKGLIEKGYSKAYNVPQEHSVVQKFWKRYNPDLLLFLQCSLETAQKRRPTIAWGQERLEQQKKKLEDAYLHKDIFICTDDLTVEGVLDKAINEIERMDK